jgi:hypothetical protein
MGDPGEILGNIDITKVGATLLFRDGADEQGMELTRLLAPLMLRRSWRWGKDYPPSYPIVEEERCTGRPAVAAGLTMDQVQFFAQQQLNRLWLLLGIQDEPERCTALGAAGRACQLVLLLVGN